jgi:hypothetical protein
MIIREVNTKIRNLWSLKSHVIEYARSIVLKIEGKYTYRSPCVSIGLMGRFITGISAHPMEAMRRKNRYTWVLSTTGRLSVM